MTAKAEKMTKAIIAGDIAEVERLIAKGYPVSGKNILKQIETGGKKLSLYTTPLEYALSEKQFDIAKLLIDSGAEMPASNSPLIRAIRLGRPDLFAYMVEHGAVLEKTKGAVVQLLANLAGNWDDAYIPWIAALHLPIKRYGGDGLHCAAQENKPRMADYLLSLGVDIDAGEDFAGDTPVLQAAQENHFEMVRYFAERGADLSIANRYGERPYTAARRIHNHEMAEYIRSMEPEELHSQEAQARRFEQYQVPKAMEEYLRSGNLRLELSGNPALSWIKLYSYMDVPEMVCAGKKVLSLVEDSDDGDITLVWEPKSRKVCFWDAEEDTLRKMGAWEEFIARPGILLDRVIVWAQPL